MSQAKKLQSDGVSRIWRSIAIGLILGIAAHALFGNHAELPHVSTVASVRGNQLPEPGSQLREIPIPGSETARPNLYIRFYDVSVLLKHGDSHPQTVQLHADRSDQLKQVITANIFPESWSDNGGDLGSISQWDSTLIIRQTAQAQLQIETLLKKLEATP